MAQSMMSFPLRSQEEYVELYKVLKALGLTDGGGEAKHVISEGLVQVNQETETRKRKKLINGDVISFNGDNIQIVSE